jgi:hypothetical protein
MILALRGGGGGGSGRKPKRELDEDAPKQPTKRPASARITTAVGSRKPASPSTGILGLAEAAMKDGNLNLALHLFNRSAHSDPKDAYALAVTVW